MSDSEEITLEQAAKLYTDHVLRQRVDPDVPEHERPANRPGAEATATLEAMLAAGRKGKVVKGA